MKPSLSAFDAVLDLINELHAILGDVANKPDLHMVIVEAPHIAHRRFEETGIPKIVCDLRHDLAHKARIDDRNCDFLPGDPAQRFLYLGEPRWLQRFRDLSYECGRALCSIDPSLEEVRSEDGIGKLIDLHWIPNLWPSNLPRVLQNINGGQGVQRFRWPDVGFSIVPYDDAEAETWAARERHMGCPHVAIPAKDVNITWFNDNIFKVSYAALIEIADNIWQNLDPEDIVAWQAEWKKVIGASSDPSGIEHPPNLVKPDPTPDIGTPGERAILAAVSLKQADKKVSVAAACTRAQVNESNVRERYPYAVAVIKKLAATDRTSRQGKRAGNGDFYSND